MAIAPDIDFVIDFVGPIEYLRYHRGVTHSLILLPLWVFGTRFGASETERVIAREAWSQPRFEFFRWFAEEPLLLRVDTGNPSTCAWFQDMRFFTPGRGTWPFRHGLCREAHGTWQVFRLDGEARTAVH